MPVCGIPVGRYNVVQGFSPASIGESTMQKSRLWMFAQSMPLAAFVVAASACGGSEPPAQPANDAPAAAPAQAPASATSARRVYFIEPQDGATVKSPVKARFGLEGYEL